jgi:hypothetical protein
MLSVGVWAIHAGIVVLCLSSIYYFHTKLEGDTPVFRRHIVLEAPGASEPQRLVVRPGNRAVVKAASGAYRFEIQDINPTWPILTGDDKGKTTCSVNVSVTTPTQSFIRQMLIGYPQYTEDIIPGKGRAIKSTGKKLVDEDIKLSFAYEPQDYFYLKETAALFVREAGSRQWIERPIEGLPHYTTHVADVSEVWQAEDSPRLEPRPLNIRIPAGGDGDPLATADVRVTGRLHYVEGFETRIVPGGSAFSPYLNIRLNDHDDVENLPMLALDPQRRSARDGQMAFVWATSPEEVESLATTVGTHLDIAVPGTEFHTTVPVDEKAIAELTPDTPFQPLGETGWSYRLKGIMPNLKVNETTQVSILVTEFKNGERTITRWVADAPERTRDVSGDHTVAEADPVITAEFKPGPVLLFVGGPAPTQLLAVIGKPDNRAAVAIGTPLTVAPHITVTATELAATSRRENRPALVPPLKQDPNAGEQRSMVKLSLQLGSWNDELWLPFHKYPLPDPQYAVPGRFMYNPSTITLPDGKRVEMILSRKRWPLPAALALEEFDLKTHVGGFVPGNTTSVRDFVSVLRAYRDGKWSEPFRCSLNKPASDAGLYYFQAEWDPGEMAFTGLGIGNRLGVHAQLIGCGISVMGMIWVFYVKPYIKRRRRTAVWEEVAETKSRADTREPVAVS